MPRYEVRQDDPTRFFRRRRYVVMRIGDDGRLDWEWEPVSRGGAAQRLVRLGHHTTDAWDAIARADAASPPPGRR